MVVERQFPHVQVVIAEHGDDLLVAQRRERIDCSSTYYPKKEYWVDLPVPSEIEIRPL